MINSVRQTVMSVLNKNNYGYISPSDFNLYAKQAQLDIFEDYFYQYNNQINKENGVGGRTITRSSGTGYADITKGLEEVIDSFSETKPLLGASDPISVSNYFLPSIATTNDDYYLINKVYIYSKTLAASINTGFDVLGNKVIDSAATFQTAGVKAGDIVSTITGGITYNVQVITVDSQTQLTVALPTGVVLFEAAAKKYNVYSADSIKETEKVNNSKITMLNNSMLTKPTLTYPAYTQEGLVIVGYPNTIIGIGQLVAQYIRFPYVPKWTYVDLTGGEPSFDQSASDYQDFELPNDDEVNLVNKILQYAGMSIREIAASQFGQAQEVMNNNEEQ